jgi:hypothetical protein
MKFFVITPQSSRSFTTRVEAERHAAHLISLGYSVKVVAL